MVRVHFVMDCVLSKPEGDGEKRLRWTTRSPSDVVTLNTDFNESLERARVSLQRNLNILENMPSGIT